MSSFELEKLVSAPLSGAGGGSPSSLLASGVCSDPSSDESIELGQLNSDPVILAGARPDSSEVYTFLNKISFKLYCWLYTKTNYIGGFILINNNYSVFVLVSYRN